MKKLPPHTTFIPISPIPDFAAKGIGDVCVAFSILELIVTQILSDALRIDYGLGRLALKDGQPKEQFKIIRKLLDYWAVKTSINLKRFEADLEKCNDARNVLAHGLWSTGPSGDLFVRVTIGSSDHEEGAVSHKLLPTLTPITEQHISGTLELIKTVTTAAKIIQDEINVGLNEWPRIVPGT